MKVSVAKGDLSLPATYVAEASGLKFRQVFALRQFPDGTIEREVDWFAMAQEGADLQLQTPASEPVSAGRSNPPTPLSHGDKPAQHVWDELFRPWTDLFALSREAEHICSALVAEAAALQNYRLQRQEIATQAWLERRAAEICGAVQPATGDLFGDKPDLSPWQTGTAEQRLRAFATAPCTRLLSDARLRKYSRASTADRGRIRSRRSCITSGC